MRARDGGERWGHRAIGVGYLLVALAAVGLGTVLSLLMRVHLAWPGLRFWGHGAMRPEEYLALVTVHGTLMVFFVMTAAPQSGFASLVLPEQIGARRMALPWMNAAGLWLTVAALGVLAGSFFVPQGAAISGWTAYPPLSAVRAAGPGQGWGMDAWIVSLGLFCAGAWLSSINVLVTIARERAEGMTWGRLPLTVWSWGVTAALILVAFGVLFAALAMLWSDRHWGTSFFVPAGDVVAGQVWSRGDGNPLLWLHLFWFFGHPEVYIAVLPGMGLVSGLLANFSRRRVAGYGWMVATTLLIGVLGLGVWGHHMFVSGMNPYAGTAFAMTTMAIAVPSTGKVLSWMATVWGVGGGEKRVVRLASVAQDDGEGGRVRLATPMLFALGFVSLFVAGGVTGPVLALPALDAYLHNTFFVVAHFHLIMGMAGMFGIFAGVYYWFPVMTGRLMHEGWGKAHFWLTLAGAYATFFPMHLEGMAGRLRHYSEVAGPMGAGAGMMGAERGITWAAMGLAGAQLIFLANVAWSARRGRMAGGNPWEATTLEWSAERRGERAAVVRGPYDYGKRWGEKDFRMQWEAQGEEE